MEIISYTFFSCYHDIQSLNNQFIQNTFFFVNNQKMIKLLIILSLLIGSVYGSCPVLNDADSFYCFTDGNQYEPDPSCGTAYNCNYAHGSSLSKWSFGSDWASGDGNTWETYGGAIIDQTSCRGMTLVTLPMPVGNSQAASANAYNEVLDMQIYITANRIQFNYSDACGECDV